MSESSPPSSTSSFASGDPSEETLRQGLDALARKDYTLAIRYLSKLQQNFAASGSVRLKARIGLVQAFEGSGQIVEAIALCQTLEHHPQAKIQRWAETTLRKLKGQAHTPSKAELETFDRSGFQPLEPSGEAITQEAESKRSTVVSDADDPSGFQSFELPEDTSEADHFTDRPAAVSNTSSPSGFQPLEPSESSTQSSGFVLLPSDANSSSTETSAPQNLRDYPSTSPGNDAGDFTADVPGTDTSTGDRTSSFAASQSDSSVSPTVDASTVDSPVEPSAPQTSLFHYEHLNSLSPPTDQPPGSIVSDTDTSAASEAIATQPSASEAAEKSQPWQFPYAGRLKRLRPMPTSKWALVKIWGIQAITVILLFWVCRAFVQQVLPLVADVLESVRWLVRIPTSWQYRTHTMPVILGLGMLLLASPWLLDWLLGRVYKQKPLSIQKLKQTHPEGCRLLRRIGQQRGWLLPALRELPTDAPLIFSYGWLPRYSRIVISRGLLKRLEDEEFATLMGYELTHITIWTAPVMSLVAVLLQLLHQGYWQMAQWGDRRANRFLKTLAAAISILSYTLYWIVRKVTIPLSRVRVNFCDRQATEWTGNPNALVRALIKLEDGIAATLSLAGHTPSIVESTDLLTPIGYETAITPGSIYPNPEFLELLNWDTQNPYRHWLSFNSSHALLGERLKRLTGYALQWQLTPELLPTQTSQTQAQSKATFWDYWFPFLQQISPYISPLIGLVVVMILWFLGGLFRPLGIWQVGWLYGDQGLLRGLILIGVGVAIMLRINRYFPDILAANRIMNPSLPKLLADPTGLPTDSVPLRLQGTLLGRRGIANWLCQDLILKTPTGLLKLHFLSSLGAIGNAFIHPQHPTEWVGRSINVQGWLRRGAIAWLDIDHFLKSGKVVARSNHPIWSVLLSLTFCGLGIYTLLRGQ